MPAKADGRAAPTSPVGKKPKNSPRDLPLQVLQRRDDGGIWTTCFALRRERNRCSLPSGCTLEFWRISERAAHL